MPTTTSRAAEATLYDLLQVDASCTPDELRAAYRLRLRALHPDLSGRVDVGSEMADLLAAWKVLSDPERRAAYDAEIEVVEAPIPDPVPPPSPRRSRRQAWVAGVQAQIRRLSTLAGRSATQTLLLKHPRGGREVYDELVDLIVGGLLEDTEPRVRAARAAGAAPLDLGVGATLVGIRTLADRVRRQATVATPVELVMTAELLDRMWDVLAHELPTTLEQALGGNPHVSRKIN